MERNSGGLVVIFDEFLTFVQNYSQGAVGAPLQSLAQGFQDNPGKALFLTFSQLDPRSFVESSATNPNQKGVLVKEVDRIDTRRTMHSVIEVVVDSYLRQAEKFWTKDTDPLAGPIISKVDQASNDTFELMTNRYVNHLGWTKGDFGLRVGQGCFPMHPATTSLFSSINWQQDVQARGTLMFVLESSRAKLDAPALVDDRPNWIMPWELVDYFKEMLGRDEYRDYEQAIHRLGNFDSPLHYQILKSVLLLTVSNVNTRGVNGFENALALMVSKNLDQVQTRLAELTASRVLIRRNDGTYLISADRSGDFDEILESKVKSLPAMVQIDLDGVISKSALLDPRTKEIQPGGGFRIGHPSDWAAALHIVYTDSINSKEKLEKLTRALVQKDGAGVRSLVVWIIPRNEVELHWAQQSLPSLLKETFESSKLPLIIMVPNRVMPEFVISAAQLRAISKFTQEEQKKAGQDSILHRRREAEESLLHGWIELSQNSEPILPPGFTSINLKTYRQPEQILPKLYEDIYPQSHGEFMRGTKISEARMINAMKEILAKVSKRDIKGLAAIGQVPGKNVVDQLRRWQLINPAMDQLIEPTEQSPISKGWITLQNKVREDGPEQQVSDLVNQLSRSPFGYDTNVLALIVVSWISQSRDIGLLRAGIPTNIESVMESTRSGSPTEILRALGATQVVRHKLSSLHELLQSEAVRFSAQELEVSEAKELRSRLISALQNETPTASDLEEAEGLSNKIESDLACFMIYEESYQAIVNELKTADSLRQLEQIAKNIGQLVSPKYLKLDESLRISTLNRSLDANIRRAIQREVSEASRLNFVSEYDAKKAQLASIRSKVTKSYRDHLGIVSQGEQSLEDAFVQMQNRERQRAGDDAFGEIQRSFASIVGPNAQLATLQKYKEMLGTVGECSLANRSLIDKTDEVLQRRILAVTNKAQQFNRALVEAVDPDKIREIRSELSKMQMIVGEGELAGKIERSLNDSEGLLKIFTNVQEIRNKSYTKPEEYSECFSALNEALASSVQLSVSQSRFIEGIEKRLREELARKTSAADGQVETLEAKLDAKKVSASEVLQNLSHSNPFTSAEGRKRVASLNSKAARLRDIDHAGQIRHLFSLIEDSQERLNLAQSLLAEVEK